MEYSDSQFGWLHEIWSKFRTLENLRFHIAEEGKGIKDGEKVKASKEEIDAFRKKFNILCTWCLC